MGRAHLPGAGIDGCVARKDFYRSSATWRVVAATPGEVAPVPVHDGRSSRWTLRQSGQLPIQSWNRVLNGFLRWVFGYRNLDRGRSAIKVVLGLDDHELWRRFWFGAGTLSMSLFSVSRSLDWLWHWVCRRSAQGSATRHKKMPGEELLRPGLCLRESPALRFAVLGLVAAAVIHAGVIGEHFHEDLFYGLFFLVVTALQLCLAWMLSTKPTLRILRYVAAMSGSIAVLYLMSRTTGLPIGPEPWRAEPFGVLDIAATCAELATLAGCAVHLRRATTATRRHAHRMLPGFTV